LPVKEKKQKPTLRDLNALEFYNGASWRICCPESSLILLKLDPKYIVVS
jgi:hypothetical protein